MLSEDVLMLIDGRPLRGLAAVRDFAAAVAREVPGVRWELEQVIAESGDAIVTRRLVDCSPATAGQSEWGVWPLPSVVCDVYRMVAGQIVEMRSYHDAEPGDETGGGDRATRGGISRLRAEQVALRRVATLVASSAAQSEILDAIVSEAAELFGHETWLYRYLDDGSGTIVAQHGAPPGGQQTDVTHRDVGEGVLGRVRRTGRPERLDSYAGMTDPGSARARRLGLTGAVAAPTVVQRRPWGALMVVTRGPPLAVGIEDRLAQFADLTATAIANAQSQAELRAVVDEEKALCRVSALVSRGATATPEVFDRVTVEASGVLDGADTELLRYVASGTEAESLARCDSGGRPTGTRIRVTGDSVIARVWRTNRAARIDDDSGVPGVELMRPRVGVSVSGPIVVEGRLWGVLTARNAGGPLPAGTEDLLSRFGELVASAIANAESRAALTASRARVVAGADEARRRLARDVHDGAQQRLVHALLTGKQARNALAEPSGRVGDLLEESLRHSESAYDDLRRLAHGILPAVLEQGGLEAAVEALVSDVALPVECEVLAERLPEAVETTAYFIIAEALTNVVKHASAGRARVRAMPDANGLALEVSDDGRGGAQPDRGSGLIGLTDRVEAAAGTITVISPSGAGTTVAATLPLTPPEMIDHAEKSG